jgi:hypothetical protein
MCRGGRRLAKHTPAACYLILNRGSLQSNFSPPYTKAPGNEGVGIGAIQYAVARKEPNFFAWGEILPPKKGACPPQKDKAARLATGCSSRRYRPQTVISPPRASRHPIGQILRVSRLHSAPGRFLNHRRATARLSACQDRRLPAGSIDKGGNSSTIVSIHSAETKTPYRALGHLQHINSSIHARPYREGGEILPPRSPYHSWRGKSFHR